MGIELTTLKQKQTVHTIRPWIPECQQQPVSFLLMNLTKMGTEKIGSPNFHTGIHPSGREHKVERHEKLA